MGEFNMDKLVKKFLKTMQDWIDKRIPEKTRDCLRTKVAIITEIKEVSVVENGEEKKIAAYNVILAGDYGTYLNLQDLYDKGEITTEDFNREISMLTLEDLVVVKSDIYAIGDYVIIGIVDNKLTNAFILYKSIKKGV